MTLSEYKDLILWALGICSTYLFFVLQKKNDKIKNIESQLSDKKYKVYHDIFSTIFDLLKDSKKIKPIDNSELVERLIDIKKDMIIYAPDEVLRKFLQWQNFVGDNPSDQGHFNIYLDLLVLIRKDMGNSKTEINKDDILRSIMTSTEEFNKFKKQLG